MSEAAAPPVYCLDANVLIQAYRGYYSFDLCPSYWDTLNQLGTAGRIFMCEQAAEEITRTNDDLAEWLENSTIEIRETSSAVIACLKSINAKDPMHRLLANNVKSRSLADPWVIAHAMACGAVVVTKEGRVPLPLKKAIKIPNVCDNMDINCLNDFEMLEEIGATFTSELPPEHGEAWDFEDLF